MSSHKYLFSKVPSGTGLTITKISCEICGTSALFEYTNHYGALSHDQMKSMLDVVNCEEARVRDVIES